MGEECCLCIGGKRRMQFVICRKFHFGLADQCDTWCVLSLCTFRIPDSVHLFDWRSQAGQARSSTVRTINFLIHGLLEEYSV